ncbi:MAG: EAL domain-containing protein [Rhodospirillales bacterium]|nr:EAL domain-containing protein [Rhodospirillales bacterium]
MAAPALAPPNLEAHIILVCADESWAAAVRQEAARDDARVAGLVVTTSPQEAMARLAAGTPAFSHLLLQAEAAGGLLGELVSLSSGEAGPASALVLLGAAGLPPAMAARVAVTVAAPVPGWLARALRPRTAARPGAHSLTTEDELRRALAGGAVRVLYQPVVRLSDRRPVGMEALARIEHPVWGTLPPEAFLPGMEAAGLLRELTIAVTEQALADWNGDRLAELDLRLGLNLPLDILSLSCLPDWLDAQCAAADVPPARVVLELTETQEVTDPAALGRAAGVLRARGYRLAIDDAGPAQRDPTELINLPFSVLKLDKSVVREAADNAGARAFLRRSIADAHAAGLTVVAEGVEDAEIWARMRCLGADHGQGYCIARPLPAAAVPLWHRAWCAGIPDAPPLDAPHGAMQRASLGSGT